MLRTARRTITSACGTTAIALLVAMAAGRCVVALRWLTRWPADSDRWWSIVLVAGALLSIVIVHRARAAASTTGAFARALDDAPLDVRSAPALVAATASGLGLGTPLGLDGPALFLGGALGARAARLLHRNERAWTLAAGVAALSMAIEAPVAAALFAAEIGRRHWPRHRDVTPLVAGSFAGWVIRRLSGDPGGVLGPAANASSRSVALATVTIGVVCGVSGGWFAHALTTVRSRRWDVGRRATVGVLTLGLAVPVAWAATGRGIFVGSGERMLAWARGTSALPIAAALAAMIVLLLALVAADVVGGLLLPMFTLGGLIGLLLARTWLPGAPAAFVIIAGGCALVAAAHAAPFTAVALGFAALGWSAASWATVVAVVLASMAAGHRRWPHVRS